jgi:hypothetical protein
MAIMSLGDLFVSVIFSQEMFWPCTLSAFVLTWLSTETLAKDAGRWWRVVSVVVLASFVLSAVVILM